MDAKLIHLAELIAKRHEIEAEIARLVGRPATMNNVGETIAALVFDIQLEPAAAPKGYDGLFRSGPLAGQKVNLQWYARLEGSLDVNPNALPDSYLVMTGPAPEGSASKDKTRPWTIAHVFVFDAREVARQLTVRQVKMGAATSLPKKWWEAAEIYPASTSRLLHLNAAQVDMLTLFKK
jgi:hypothetical protein